MPAVVVEVGASTTATLARVTSRMPVLATALAVMLALGACGGASDGSSTPSDPPATELDSDDVAAAPAEVATDDAVESDDVADDSGVAEGGCDQVLTSDEVESVFGSPAEFNGSGEVCTVRFADDAIGNFQVWSGSKADEAIDFLLPQFQADQTASANGVLLDADRGFVYDQSAVVRGDSGRVYRFDAPGNLDVADIQAAMQGIADLLLSR